MTTEVLRKHIEDMEIYVPVCSIESNLGMPKTTIQQVLNGHRKLPKKWVKVLERYFRAKFYLGKNVKHEVKVGDKVNLPQEAIISKVEKKDGATKVSFTEPNQKKEMPQGLSRSEIMKWRKDNGQF
jgi:hypothetical protein